MNDVRVLLLNDLHLEFQDYEPASAGYDVAVLAGDIHTKTRGVRWALERFTCPVVYVPGNHEGYGTHWEHNLEKMKAMARGTHVHVLERDRVDLLGVRFLGATGWSTFSLWPDQNQAMQAAGAGKDLYSAGARDYRMIRTGAYRRLRPIDTAVWSTQTKRWFTEALAEPFAGPTVAVTHHPPSARSLKHGRAMEPLDACDANPWDDLVEASGARFWFHGHTHHKTHYRIGATDVVTNPRGYPGQTLGHAQDGVWTVKGSSSASG